jgi:hypothetical protein
LLLVSRGALKSVAGATDKFAKIPPRGHFDARAQSTENRSEKGLPLHLSQAWPFAGNKTQAEVQREILGERGENIRPPRWWGSFGVSPMDQALARQRQLQRRGP